MSHTDQTAQGLESCTRRGWNIFVYEEFPDRHTQPTPAILVRHPCEALIQNNDKGATQEKKSNHDDDYEVGVVDPRINPIKCVST